MRVGLTTNRGEEGSVVATVKVRRAVIAALLVMVAVLGVVLAIAWQSGPVPPELPPGAPTGCQGVRVDPSDDLQSSLDSHAEGTTFCLAPGVYRLDASLVPKAGQQLVGVGSRTAVISGAQVVRASSVGDSWVVDGQQTLGSSEFNHTSQCRAVAGRDPEGLCVYRDQVFLDGQSLWQVGSFEELSPGEFYWDYGANEIHLVDDPSGRMLEVSAVADVAIASENPGVVIKHLVVEKFGNAVQTGAIQADLDWTIVDSEIRLNHGAGVHMGPGTVLRRNSIHHNGQLGIHGGQTRCSATTGLNVEGNEIAFNNAAGYNWGFEGGASKWTNTDGLIVRNNYVHDNHGMGLWTDGANINTLFVGNRVENNAGMGINHELGYATVISGNIVSGNGFEHPVQGEAWGAGIFIDQSRDVEVYDNVVEGNAAGITAVHEPASEFCGYGVAETADVLVHDNTIAQENGIAAGLQLTRTSDASYYRSKNNRWRRNTYRLGDPNNGLHFFWIDGEMEGDEWRSQGNDQDGTFAGNP